MRRRCRPETPPTATPTSGSPCWARRWRRARRPRSRSCFASGCWTPWAWTTPPSSAPMSRCQNGRCPVAPRAGARGRHGARPATRPPAARSGQPRAIWLGCWPPPRTAPHRALKPPSRGQTPAATACGSASAGSPATRRVVPSPGTTGGRGASRRSRASIAPQVEVSWCCRPPAGTSTLSGGACTASRRTSRDRRCHSSGRPCSWRWSAATPSSTARGPARRPRPARPPTVCAPSAPPPSACCTCGSRG
ncbi:hypothetical protein BH23ACT8_BH23ACT8_21110 [soil metagenome]